MRETQEDPEEVKAMEDEEKERRREIQRSVSMKIHKMVTSPSQDQISGAETAETVLHNIARHTALLPVTCRLSPSLCSGGGEGSP